MYKIINYVYSFIGPMSFKAIVELLDERMSHFSNLSLRDTSDTDRFLQRDARFYIY